MPPAPKTIRLFEDGSLALKALGLSLTKLAPWTQWHNTVLFVVYLGAITCSIATVLDPSPFHAQVTGSLWFTVVFANWAEALAEGRAEAQAASLRAAQKEARARLWRDGQESRVPAHTLKKGDVVVCDAGDVIPGDGEVIEGSAAVDESAITGESAPMIRESGGDRSAVTGGTQVISDRILIRITAEAGHTFLDRMIHMVEGAKRQPTPNEVALRILLVSLTLIFVMAVGSLRAFVHYSEAESGLPQRSANVIELTALLVCLIPTTIGGLLSAIGISGMNHLIQQNVVARSGKAVEAAGDIDVILLDKTGTITLGSRMASAFRPAPRWTDRELAQAAQWASIADKTPEGRSIVVLAQHLFGLRAKDLPPTKSTFVPFSARSRMSGIILEGEGQAWRDIRKGAMDAIKGYVAERGYPLPPEIEAMAQEVSRQGATPLLVACDGQAMGLVVLQDVVKKGIKERFADLRRMGIRTVMITGDNPTTAAAIAREAGVDDFVAEASPETKLVRIRAEQAAGHLVGMIGDGTNDAPALAQADVGVAMNTGTQAAREAGNMVDLDSDPTKLLEIVETGKRLLMTRGALTTFSIANDVAKYFTILPAILGGLYALPGEEWGPLARLNLLGLESVERAILSAVIFNALIIVVLIPLALRGVSYQPMGAAPLLRRNLAIYGLGGLLAPFVGIKVIDMLLKAVGGS